MKGPKKTNRYSDEFKIKAVQLANHPDILAKDVAEDLGVINFSPHQQKRVMKK
ncbi:MAG: transposase [Thermodesulfobacteriota bacterium]|nr:transposase [Thermodesulfobacteriota bacterium]